MAGGCSLEQADGSVGTIVHRGNDKRLGRGSTNKPKPAATEVDRTRSKWSTRDGSSCNETTAVAGESNRGVQFGHAADGQGIDGVGRIQSQGAIARFGDAEDTAGRGREGQCLARSNVQGAVCLKREHP